MGASGNTSEFQTYPMLAKADISDVVFGAFSLVSWREKTEFYLFRCHLSGEMDSSPLLPTMCKINGRTLSLEGIKLVYMNQIPY